MPCAQHLISSPRGERERELQRQAQGRVQDQPDSGPPFCVSLTPSPSPERAPGKKHLSVCSRASASRCRPEALGRGLFCSPVFSKPAALPRPSWASAVRGKLESDPWRRAWSPWQPRIYDRGLHPAWRTFWTFDLKQEEGNPEVVSPGSREPRAAPRSPQMVSERVGVTCQAGWGERGGTSMESFPDCFPLSAAGQVSFPGPN